MLSRLVLRALARVDPERRRLWAARVFTWSLAGWLVSHVGLLVLPEWFFQHVLLGISWLAITTTAADVICSTDVRVEQDKS